MNPEREFNTSEEITYFADPGHELYSLSERTFFYLAATASAIESFAESAFTVEPVLSPKNNAVVGCAIKFIIRRFAFLIDTGTRVRLWAASADEPDESRDRYLTCDGDASDPKSWESLLVQIGRCEKFYVAVPHADKLRHMWTQWTLMQQRRRDERGW